MLELGVSHAVPLLAKEPQDAGDRASLRVLAGQPLQRTEHLVDSLLLFLQDFAKPLEVALRLWRALAIGAFQGVLEMLCSMPIVENLRCASKHFLAPSPHVPFLLL